MLRRQSCAPACFKEMSIFSCSCADICSFLFLHPEELYSEPARSPATGDWHITQQPEHQRSHHGGSRLRLWLHRSPHHSSWLPLKRIVSTSGCALPSDVGKIQHCSTRLSAPDIFVSCSHQLADLPVFHRRLHVPAPLQGTRLKATCGWIKVGKIGIEETHTLIYCQ